MRDRQSQLLNYTVRSYIKTAQPVGSNLLMEKSGISISSATIRNELLELETEGYLYQPHTSAGRVPTEKGYKFWLKNFFKERELNKKKRSILSDAKKRFKLDRKRQLKEIARVVAELSRATVIIGFERHNFYHTGISQLFTQPEFREYDLVCNISEIVDCLDEKAPDLFDEIGNDAVILIGNDNPFSENCSIVSVNFNDNLFVLLGPIRMNYEENAAIIKYLKELI
ncbi:hypothetical protein KAI52_04120 [Candidatus Parcubacteria bacterium]|nr:hypothetical protein [Candidatus Parcubacteria bacterium]